MTCKCGSQRLVEISGKCSDLCFTTVNHLNLEKDGYAPFFPFTGGGDYVELNFCADCGYIQKFSPQSDEQIKKALDIEEDEEDEDE